MTTDQTGQMGASESRGVGESGPRPLEASEVVVRLVTPRQPSYMRLEDVVRALAETRLDYEQDEHGHTVRLHLLEHNALEGLVYEARCVLNMPDPTQGHSPCPCDSCFQHHGADASGGAR